jgi:hypothetical protein
MAATSSVSLCVVHVNMNSVDMRCSFFIFIAQGNAGCIYPIYIIHMIICKKMGNAMMRLIPTHPRKRWLTCRYGVCACVCVHVPIVATVAFIHRVYTLQIAFDGSRYHGAYQEVSEISLTLGPNDEDAVSCVCAVD